MSKSRMWPGIAACRWAPNTKSGESLHADGLGSIAEIVHDRGWLYAHYPEGRGLMIMIPGGGTTMECQIAAEAIYGKEPGTLPSREEFDERWQEWMEGRR